MKNKTILIYLASVLFIIFAVISYKGTVNMKVFNHSEKGRTQVVDSYEIEELIIEVIF